MSLIHCPRCGNDFESDGVAVCPHCDECITSAGIPADPPKTAFETWWGGLPISSFPNCRRAGDVLIAKQEATEAFHAGESANAAEVGRLRQRVTKLEESLEVVLPMAVGYAMKDTIDRELDLRLIEQAQSVLEGKP